MLCLDHSDHGKGWVSGVTEWMRWVQFHRTRQKSCSFINEHRLFFLFRLILTSATCRKMLFLAVEGCHYVSIVLKMFIKTTDRTQN